MHAHCEIFKDRVLVLLKVLLCVLEFKRQKVICLYNSVIHKHEWPNACHVKRKKPAVQFLTKLAVIVNQQD